MDDRKVLVTGAGGYLGSAVARAFRNAGLTTYGMIRTESGAKALEREEINPIVADVGNVSGLSQIKGLGFDIIVSNTEDLNDPAGHLSKVDAMLDHLTSPKLSSGRQKPLIMFTSGSKDYGNMEEVAGDPGLRPHIETSPVRPHPFAAARAAFAKALLDRDHDHYDTLVLRPALLYGRAAGLFGLLFEFAAIGRDTLTLNARANAIMHSVHVDDCATAYVALAQHSDRDALTGQAFNIANKDYETAGEVAAALAQAYGRDLAFNDPDDDLNGFNVHLLANTSQWVGSEKIRNLTGWTEVMPSLSSGMPQYRMAYEAREIPFVVQHS